jgi:hypothetical protein
MKRYNHEFRFWTVDAGHRWTKMPCIYKRNTMGQEKQNRTGKSGMNKKRRK